MTGSYTFKRKTIEERIEELYIELDSTPRWRFLKRSKLKHSIKLWTRVVEIRRGIV